MLVLVTGATGKVGRHFIKRFLTAEAFAEARVRVLCHNRTLPETERVEVVRGSISEWSVAERAMAGVTHVVHLATCKEVPETVMDVTVKGMFWLLEAFRKSKVAERFILIGGDAAMGHFFYPYFAPVTEKDPHRAYAGCYALSKVLEEVMLQQYAIQYGIDTCCLRAPWIMEKDDFRYTLSFGEDQFGGPLWREMVPAADAARYYATGTIPLLLDASGAPLKRNFVHVDDLAAAIILALRAPAARQETFNISMDEPVDYEKLADHLQKTRGLEAVRVASEYHSTWLDNTKAKLVLGWRPRYDLAAMIEGAWGYQRDTEDSRRVWYPG